MYRVGCLWPSRKAPPGPASWPSTWTSPNTSSCKPSWATATHQPKAPRRRMTPAAVLVSPISSSISLLARHWPRGAQLRRTPAKSVVFAGGVGGTTTALGSALWRRGAHADVQLAKLLLADFRRRIRHRIGGGLRLREGDDFTDTVRARHQHRQPIQPKRDTAMRWRPELQRIQQEPEFLLRFLGVDPQQVEHRRLHILPVNTHRATTVL